jgi:hypothetical protein
MAHATGVLASMRLYQGMLLLSQGLFEERYVWKDGKKKGIRLDTVSQAQILSKCRLAFPKVDIVFCSLEENSGHSFSYCAVLKKSYESCISTFILFFFNTSEGGKSKFNKIGRS